MVFRLNGGGDFTPLGAVDEPVAVDVGVVGVVGVGVVGVDVALLGDTSGENTAPSAYSDRFKPYVFARSRSTSRISTSNTTSARGLSFCSITRSRIAMIVVLARMVIVLFALFMAIAG